MAIRTPASAPLPPVGGVRNMYVLKFSQQRKYGLGIYPSLHADWENYVAQADFPRQSQGFDLLGAPTSVLVICAFKCSWQGS